MQPSARTTTLAQKKHTAHSTEDQLGTHQTAAEQTSHRNDHPHPTGPRSLTMRRYQSKTPKAINLSIFMFTSCDECTPSCCAALSICKLSCVGGVAGLSLVRRLETLGTRRLKICGNVVSTSATSGHPTTTTRSSDRRAVPDSFSFKRVPPLTPCTLLRRLAQEHSPHSRLQARIQPAVSPDRKASRQSAWKHRDTQQLKSQGPGFVSLEWWWWLSR